MDAPQKGGGGGPEYGRVCRGCQKIVQPGTYTSVVRACNGRAQTYHVQCGARAFAQSLAKKDKTE